MSDSLFVLVGRRIREFDEVHQEVDSSLEILGFIDIADIASPQALSRHLVLPLPSKEPKPSDNGVWLRFRKWQFFLQEIRKWYTFRDQCSHISYISCLERNYFWWHLSVYHRSTDFFLVRIWLHTCVYLLYVVFG